MSTLKRLIVEAHRRSLWQVLGVYLVASWVIYQVVVALWEGIGLPSWVPGTALALLLIGLPVVLATAFVQEGAPGLGGGGGPGSDADAAEARPDAAAPETAPDAAPVPGLETTAETITAEGRTTEGHEQEAAAAPGDRPAPGTSLTPDPTTSPTPTTKPRSGRLFTWSRAITGGVLAFAALGLAAAGFMGMRALGIGPAATLITSGQLSERDEIVLADFESLTGDSVLSRVVTEAFRADLAQSDVMRLATASDVAYVMERMQQGERTVLTPEVARQVATRGGMKALIAGEIGRLGGRYVLSARVVGALDGEVLATFRETATDSTELVPAVDRLAKSVREKVGESLRSIRQSPYLMAITTPSLPALKKLVRAQDAAARGDEPRALDLLEEAISLDPEFSEAHRKRGAILFNRGRVSEALAAFDRALERPDRLTDYERYHTRALAAQARGEPTEAISEFQALLEMDSADTRALNNLGVTYLLTGQYDRAAETYGRAVAVVESDSSQEVFAGTYVGAALGLWATGRRDSARAMIQRLQTLSPTALGVWVTRAQFAAATGRYDEALEHARLLIERFPGNRDAVLLGRHGASLVYATRGQIGRARQELRQFMDHARQTDQPGWVLVAGARIALLEGAVLGDTAAALKTLRETRSATPLDSVTDPPFATLAMAYAAAGRVDSARAVTDRLRARPTWFRRSIPYMLPSAEAAIAQAEGDYAAAETGWRRASAAAQGCDVCFGARIALVEELQGDTAEAIAAYEAYLDGDEPWRAGWGRQGWTPQSEGDFLHRGLTLERLGALHEAEGNRAEAARYYQEFIDLWQEADPELQPRVDAARRALERLTAEGGG